LVFAGTHYCIVTNDSRQHNNAAGTATPAASYGCRPVGTQEFFWRMTAFARLLHVPCNLLLVPIASGCRLTYGAPFTGKLALIGRLVISAF
jgi:hypothetical protein